MAVTFWPAMRKFYHWPRFTHILDELSNMLDIPIKKLTAVTAAGLTLPLMASDNAQQYRIDASASNAKAKVAFFGLASKTARFPKISGNARIDPKKISSLSLNVNIDARALTAGDGVTLKRLKGKDFFHVTKYPAVRFSGTGLKLTGPKKGTVSGKLTARGITRPVSLAVTFSQPIAQAGAKKPISLTAVTKINRRDFGMTAYSGIVGKTVKISVNTRLLPR